MTASNPSRGALLLLSTAVAFGACYVAVSEHSAVTATAYRLERAQRRHAELERRREAVRSRLITVSNPERVRRRAADFGLVVGSTHALQPSDLHGDRP